MKTYSIKFFGTTYRVYPVVSKYRNGRLAVSLMNKTKGGYSEPFANLTVNLVNETCPANCAYLDTNNFPDGEDFVLRHRLGKPTGKLGFSGYCAYPLYRFDMDALNGKEKKEPHPFGL